jgi:competence protein ComFC
LCGDPVAGAVDHDFICFSCSAEKPSFSAARSAARYDGVMGEALRRLKYEHAFWLVPDVVQLMEQCLRAEYGDRSYDVVVPVPLYHTRRRSRGFNQSDLLARTLGRRLGIPCRPDAVRRIQPTSTQTNLTAKERLSNVMDAFYSREEKWLAGRSVLLVDDVMTTGATVNACAKALKQGGAGDVFVLTAARG